MPKVAKKIVLDGEEVNIPVGGGSVSIPTGVVWMWSGIVAPDGWVLCDGTQYQIDDYPELSAFFEEQYGRKNYFGGNGTTTFAVPDMRGRFALGASDEHEMGETGGSEEVTLTVEQMPGHSHTINITRLTNVPTGGSNNVISDLSGSLGKGTRTSGSSQPHPNMPPYYVLAYIIKL